MLMITRNAVHAFTCSISELLQSCQLPSLAESTPPAAQYSGEYIADLPYFLSPLAALCGMLVAVGGAVADPGGGGGVRGVHL